MYESASADPNPPAVIVAALVVFVSVSVVRFFVVASEDDLELLSRKIWLALAVPARPRCFRAEDKGEAETGRVFDRCKSANLKVGNLLGV